MRPTPGEGLRLCRRDRVRTDMVMKGRFIEFSEAKGENAGASVLVAMSGGVDSAVAAVLLLRAGFRVTGLTMKNFCYAEAGALERSCCSIESVQDARRECDRLGIPHRVADVEESFNREVIDDFVAEYRNARTPNPCVRCNTYVRFRTLLDSADSLGIGHVATGHYARVFEREDGTRFVARASHLDKDQSYFLAGVRGTTLRRVLFPLGEADKSGVRRLAREASMSVAEKTESQEVCFVQGGGVRAFLEARGVRSAPGKIENTNGEIVGEHGGFVGYTVGQRRQLGIAAGTPRYVVRLDKKRNVLVIGEGADLLSPGLSCTFDWIDPSVPRDVGEIRVQIRYRHTAAPVARVEVNGAVGRIQFESPQRAVCPGQTVVLYRGDIVVGAGVIDES